MNEPSHHDRERTILIVDGTTSSRVALSMLLRDHYQVDLAHDGAEALTRVTGLEPPDLILLATDMPGIDGFEVCRTLKGNPSTQSIPIIFLLASGDPEHEARCFESGGADCIAQPYYPATVRARVRTQIGLRAGATAEAVTIFALASLAEIRDSNTGNHILRTQNYVKCLAYSLQQHPKFTALLTHNYIANLYKSVPLYDMGSIGIPDRVLLKPSSLSGAEFDIMKTHTTLGRNAISHAEKALGTGSAMLTITKDLVYSHQEKWDGSGYPQGLVGEEIPVSARLMAIADVYDALISTRVYKDGVPHHRAVQVIFQSRDSHFDPDMVDAFIEIQDEFNAIAQRYPDTELDLQKKIEYLANAIAENP